MNVARSVAEVLAEHVTFEVECIDRMYCNVYVPRLQYAGGLVGYVHQQLGLPIASTAPLASDHRPVRPAGARVRPAASDPVGGLRQGSTQGRRHARPARRVRGLRPDRGGGVHRPGAGEDDTVFRTEKRRNAQGRSYPWIVKSTGMVNHFYFYCLDDDFGPFFLKFCSYFPYNAKLCLNGHHWAQRQAAKAGIGFTAMDNAFAAVDDVETLQAICDSLGPAQIYALLDKWLSRLPDPFTDADRDAGYRYQVSILQAEFSLTQMLDAPGHRPGLLRTRHPRQPRRRPRRPGRADLRPAHPPRPETVHAEPVPDPGDHRRGHPDACTPSTSTPRSSSTTRKGERCGPRPPSTTAGTSDVAERSR